MGILAKDDRQLNYIYSSESHLGKQVRGYVEGIDEKIRVIDIAKEKLGHTVWADISQNLNVPLGDLFSPDHPDAPDVGDTADFSADDWLKLIDHNPALLQNPIAVMGDNFKIVNGRNDVLNFYDVDSAGLEKTFHTEPPTISQTTDDQDFVANPDTTGSKDA